MLSHIDGSSAGEGHLEMGLAVPVTWRWRDDEDLEQTQNLHLGFVKSNKKKENTSPTIGLGWHRPFNVVRCKDRLLDAAALHQIIGEHGRTQAILGVTGHEQQLRQRMGGGVSYHSVNTDPFTITHAALASSWPYPVRGEVHGALLGPLEQLRLAGDIAERQLHVLAVPQHTGGETAGGTKHEVTCCGQIPTGVFMCTRPFEPTAANRPCTRTQTTRVQSEATSCCDWPTVRVSHLAQQLASWTNTGRPWSRLRPISQNLSLIYTEHDVIIAPRNTTDKAKTNVHSRNRRVWANCANRPASGRLAGSIMLTTHREEEGKQNNRREAAAAEFTQ